jgi:phage terminase large subunit-like protein
VGLPAGTLLLRHHGSVDAFRAQFETEDEADAACQDLATAWRWIGRPEQIMPGEAGAAVARAVWRTWLLMAGRGFGKTRTGAETTNDLVNQGRIRSIALIAPTLRTARRKMVEDPVAGLVATAAHDNVPVWNKSDQEVHWPNGAIGYVFTAEEPEGVRGFNGDFAWCEEVGSWAYPNETWSNLQLGLRMLGPRGDRARAIITSTPRPIELIKRLVDNPSTVITGGTTYDNAANLDPEALAEFVALYEGTRLGRQELLAQLLGDTPGALWTLALLDKNRVRRAPELKRVVVAIDPATKDPSAVAADEELESDKGSETGIVVMGIGECSCRGHAEIHGFVLEDASDYYTPREWAEKAAELYAIHQADLVVAEENQGGALVESNLMTLGGRHLNYRGVNASRGKQTRAQPVASLGT